VACADSSGTPAASSERIASCSETAPDWIRACISASLGIVDACPSPMVVDVVLVHPSWPISAEPGSAEPSTAR
jgi:hypothetical protein